MTVLTVCSTKHSPGATTFALALAAAWTATANGADLPPVLVEADAAGGDLAARLGVALDPGLMSFAAAARNGRAGVDLLEHTQPLPCGGSVVLAPSNPEQSAIAIDTVAQRLCTLLRDGGGVIDCGRWTAGSSACELVRASDYTLVVVRPDVAGIEHFEERLESLSAAAGGRIGVVLAGERPYDASAVRAATCLPFVAAMPVDRHGAEALTGASPARSARKSRLVRSARSILDEIEVRVTAGVSA